mmetsp:Transcript_76788/g.237160  ORF Transcript_76788/g.237160 Transcript_76788/m.237160 type:complete len:356 (-) Transcript_76788:836-1903(-)
MEFGRGIRLLRRLGIPAIGEFEKELGLGRSEVLRYQTTIPFDLQALALQLSLLLLDVLLLEVQVLLHLDEELPQRGVATTLALLMEGRAQLLHLLELLPELLAQRALPLLMPRGAAITCQRARVRSAGPANTDRRHWSDNVAAGGLDGAGLEGYGARGSHALLWPGQGRRQLGHCLRHVEIERLRALNGRRGGAALHGHWQHIEGQAWHRLVVHHQLAHVSRLRGACGTARRGAAGHPGPAEALGRDLVGGRAGRGSVATRSAFEGLANPAVFRGPRPWQQVLLAGHRLLERDALCTEPWVPQRLFGSGSPRGVKLDEAAAEAARVLRESQAGTFPQAEKVPDGVRAEIHLRLEQ